MLYIIKRSPWMGELPYQSLPDRPYYEGAETHHVAKMLEMDNFPPLEKSEIGNCGWAKTLPAHCKAYNSNLKLLVLDKSNSLVTRWHKNSFWGDSAPALLRSALRRNFVGNANQPKLRLGLAEDMITICTCWAWGQRKVLGIVFK